MTNQESKTLTRESIKIALIQLMQQYSLEEITVTAILERAGVSRAGFYRNYTSKEAVFDEIIQNFYNKISLYFLHELNTKNHQERYIALFQYLKEQTDLIKLFFIIQQKNSHFSISNPYVDEAYAHLLPEQQYCAHALWRGVREIVTRWMANGMQESPEVMGKLVTDLFNFDMIPMN